MKIFLTDSTPTDPYILDMLRLYSLIKLGIVSITYNDYESMNERDIIHIMAIAEADITAQEVKNKSKAFMEGIKI